MRTDEWNVDELRQQPQNGAFQASIRERSWNRGHHLISYLFKKKKKTDRKNWTVCCVNTPTLHLVAIICCSSSTCWPLLTKLVNIFYALNEHLLPVCLNCKNILLCNILKYNFLQKKYSTVGENMLQSKHQYLVYIPTLFSSKDIFCHWVKCYILWIFHAIMCRTVTDENNW